MTTTEELWANYQPGDIEARNKIIEYYYTLVRKVAVKVSRKLPKTVAVDDLVGYGNFGLIGAIDRFEPDRGFKFETYAARRIHGAILDGLRDNDWVPRSVRSRNKEVQRVSERLEGELGRHPTVSEIAVDLNIGEDQVLAASHDAHTGIVTTIESFNDGENANENALNYGMALAEPGDASTNLDLEVIVDSLTGAIGTMDERERIVIHLVYWEDMSMADIGIVLGVTESRVCQILTKANSQLKNKLDFNVN